MLSPVCGFLACNVYVVNLMGANDVKAKHLEGDQERRRRGGEEGRGDRDKMTVGHERGYSDLGGGSYREGDTAGIQGELY